MKRGQALPSWRQAVLAVLISRRRQRQQAEAFHAHGAALVGSIHIRRWVKCYRAGTHTAGGCSACGVQ